MDYAVWITEDSDNRGSDNQGSDNQGPTVLLVCCSAASASSCHFLAKDLQCAGSYSSLTSRCDWNQKQSC